jgi:hypothetical protein
MLTSILRLFALFSLATASVQAAINITIIEDGLDVLLSGSGTANLTALTLFTTTSYGAGMSPEFGVISIGPTSPVDVDVYSGISGITAFGSGSEGADPASSGSGDAIGYQAFNSFLALPSGYSSGDPLNSSTTYTGASFASLGITPGTYTATWGSGGTADSITLSIVPEPSNYAGLFGFVALGFVACRRKRKV